MDLLLPPDPGPPDPGPRAARLVAPLPGARTMALAGATMGTGWSLTAIVPATLDQARVERTLNTGFAAVIAQMSQWDASSSLSRYNCAAPGSEHVLPPQLAHVLDCAVAVARASGGAFDPTVGRLADDWGFGAAAFGGTAPGPDRIAADRAPGHAAIARHLADGVLVQPGGLALDLSGIAKGFAVDLGLALLARLGIAHALLEIGGELKGVGLRADGLPWWVDLEPPPPAAGAAATGPPVRIGLTGWAVATSGHWHRRRSGGGRSWSHTLDPRTGAPVGDHVLAVSVLHRGCMQADALATAIAVLGEGAGIAFADRHAIPARIVTRTGTAESAAWAGWRA